MVFDEATEQRLLADDPTLTSLTLRTSDVAHLPNYSYRVGLALGRSTHITHLDLELNMFHDDVELFENDDDTADLNDTALRQAMNHTMNKPALESLRLGSSGFDERYTHQTSIAAGCLFRAVNERTAKGLDAVKSLSLHSLILEAESMVALFQNGALQDFTLDCCIIGPTSLISEENEVRQVARSFASCTTLTDLTLGVFNENVALVCALLEDDANKLSINTLFLRNECDNDDSSMRLATALSKFLRSSSGPLTMLGLIGFVWTGQSFAPIAETISTAQTAFNLGGGSMDTETCALVRSMYPPDGEAHALILFMDIQFPDTNEYQTLVELIGSTPGLTGLALGVNDSNAAMFIAVARGLKSRSCAIETLALYGRLSDTLWEVFVNALPQFCSVEKLEMERLVTPDHWNEDLMEGFRKNRSLKEVCIEGMDASNRSRLDFYLQRNKELPKVIQLEALAFSSQSSTPVESDGAVVANSEDVASTTTSTTTAGKLLPPLFQASMDSAVPVGVSNVIGGLLCADENLGQRLASKRTHSDCA